MNIRLLVSVLLISGLAFTQSFQGSLRGRILDPSGAAVQSAKLTITDEATKLSRSTITNDQGEYAFNAVTPANYTVNAEAPGFKRLERPGILVSTQAAVTVDLRLELGAVDQAEADGRAVATRVVEKRILDVRRRHRRLRV